MTAVLYVAVGIVAVLTLCGVIGLAWSWLDRKAQR